MPSPLVIKSRYEIKTVLGRGGMGVVYQAYDRLMKRDVAVKTLREVPDGIMVELFYRECTVLAGMVHPNVVEIFDMGEFEDSDKLSRPFFVMPLLPGQTLYDLVYPAANPLAASRCVDIISQACRGLQAAHDRGLLHRDIKPRNIFVMKDDAVKLIDFGVAHLMGNNSTGIRGTPQYMSPEQITFKPLERQSDVFSMAAVCYEALTAVHPFLRNPDGRDSGAEIASAIVGYTPPLVSDLTPSVNRALAQVVAKGMAKDPWNRFDSAAAFADALQKALRNEGMPRLNAAGVQIRIERARRSLQQKDFQFASEIIGELESEGHSDPNIRQIRGDLEEALKTERTERLIEAATRYFASEEFTLALRRVQEILQVEPANTPALGLKKKIEDVLTEQNVSELLKTATECIDRAAFTSARQAIQDALKLRPNDARVRQLLNEVDARQKEILRHRQDQERLFQAAHEAWLSGRIKAALTSLEQLTAFTTELHEPGDRIKEYQGFYQRVRTEQDAVESALAQAWALLSEGDFPGVQGICDRYLRKYPEHEDFVALSDELGKRRQEEAQAFRAAIAKRLAAETDLNAMAGILREALTSRPKDDTLEQELARVTHKQHEVQCAVQRARSFEQQQEFAAAIVEWESLSVLYPQYSDLENLIAKARLGLQTQREQARTTWIARITGAVGTEDYEAAARLLDDAGREFPNDAGLQELAALTQAQAKMSAAVHSLIQKGIVAAKAHQFDLASKALSEAGELESGVPNLVKSIGAALVEASNEAVDANWQTAKAFLERAAKVDSAVEIPSSLREQIELREREESVENVLKSAEQEQGIGLLQEARGRLELALQSYPKEGRLRSRLEAISHRIEQERQRQEQTAALQKLTSLHDALRDKDSAVDLQNCVSDCEAIARQYPSDLEIAQVAAQVIEEGAAFEDATEALAHDEPKDCVARCEEILSRLPDFRLFLNLRAEAEVREAQKAAEYLDSIERQLAAEPDLSRRTQILETAVQKNPGEPYYQEGLRLVQGKQELVKEVVSRAKALEADGWFSEALDRWQYLETIHPTFAGLGESIARCSQMLAEKREHAKQQHVSTIRAALEKREYASALQGFAKARLDFPGDADLLELAGLAEEGRDKRLHCEKLLEAGRRHLGAGRFEAGQKVLGDAVNADPTNGNVAKSVAGMLIEYARDALAVDLTRAEAMISDACSLIPSTQVPPDLQAALHAACRQREFKSCAESVAKLEADNDLSQAITLATEFLQRFPNDREATALQMRLIVLQEEFSQREQRTRDLEELSRIGELAETVAEGPALRDLLDRTEQIAGRNVQNSNVAVVAIDLRNVLSAQSRIRHLLTENKLVEAEGLCAQSIDRFPNCVAFADLRLEVLARQRARSAEYLSKVERELASEPDFFKHVAILEEASRTYPDETYYADELQLVCNRKALLEREVARARELEEAELYEGALQEWEALRELYPWFKALDAEILRINTLLAQKKTELVQAWMTRIEAALTAAQYDIAAELLENAWEELPNAPELLTLQQQLAATRQKQAAAQQSFSRAESHFDAGDLNEALGCFDSALQFMPDSRALRGSIAAVLLAKAQAIVGNQWEEASRLTAKIAQVDPGFAIPSELRDEIRLRREASELAKTLGEIDNQIANERWTVALEHIKAAQRSNPEEPRFRERLTQVNAALQGIEAERLRAAALQWLNGLQAKLATAKKQRSLVKLKASIEASSFLLSGDKEVQSKAHELLSQLTDRMQVLDGKRAEAVANKDQIGNGSKSPFGRPTLLAGFGLALASAGVVFWLFHSPSLKAVSFTTDPVGVLVQINATTCVTPNCAFKLKPGLYRAQLSKDGYVPRTVSLALGSSADAANTFSATMVPLAPGLQITGNTYGVSIYLDGTKVSSNAEGQLTLTPMKQGRHTLAIETQGGRDSVAVVWKNNGRFDVQGSIEGPDLPIVAVAEEDDGTESLLTSAPSAQPVYVDNKRIGVSDRRLLHLGKLSGGPHQIQVGPAGGLLKFGLPAEPRPSLYAFIARRAGTGTLSVSTNIPDADLIVDGKRYSGTADKGLFRLTLPVKTYEIRSERSGYIASGTSRVRVEENLETTLKLNLRPLQVPFEIRGAASGTAVKLDGTLIGVIAGVKPLQGVAAPGTHVFEFGRDGYQPKRVQRRLDAGMVAIIAGSDVELGSILNAEAIAWKKASASGRLAEMQEFLRKYPIGLHTAAANQQVQQIEWDAVDKQSAAALQAYLKNHPQSAAHSVQGRQILSALEESETAHNEQADWTAADKVNRKSVEEFLGKHPAGAHAEAAGRLIADLKKKEDLTQLDRAEANAWNGVNTRDRQSVEGFLKAYPAGRHVQEADRLLLNLPPAGGASHDESPAVMAAVQRLAEAWNARNPQAIVDAEPSLNKRAIKSQLDALTSIQVTITALSAPQVSGDRAKVICRRRLEQIFSDGTHKSPESTVTFVLVKSGGRWIIESAM